MLAVAASWAFAQREQLGSGYVVRVAAMVAAGALVLFIALPAHAPHARFGSANQVTLARAALVLLLLALIGTPRIPQPAAITLAVIAALLDLLDGRLARASGITSRYGARFDMETDALLILTLAVLLWRSGAFGAWILISGALRYLFLAATRVLPRLRGTLAPSRRRQTIAVVQVVALLIAFAPFVPLSIGVPCAVIGLVALLLSFTVDTVALWRGKALRA